MPASVNACATCAAVVAEEERKRILLFVVYTNP